MNMLEQLAVIVLAVGGLGTAAMGVVEGLKISTIAGRKPTRQLGFDEIEDRMKVFSKVFRAAYGPDPWEVLCAQYCGSREGVATALRQGVRVGLTKSNAPDVAETLGWDKAGGKALAKAAEAARTPLGVDEDALSAPKRKDLENARLTLGQYELAMDARIDAAMAMANSRYSSGVRMRALYVSVAIALFVAVALLISDDNSGSFSTIVRYIVGGIVVGLAAVPMAPVAKDVTAAIQHAATALRKRS